MPAASLASPAARARELAPMLKALSDENRLTLLLALADQDSSVVELVQATGMSQPLVSHHLKALRAVGLVTSAAVGRSNVYSLCCDAVAQPIELLADLSTPSCNPKGI